MANKHYGNLGDIWKHLPLAEILSIEKPMRYWESHAGSARYPLTHSAERDYGIYHFFKHAPESPILIDSEYFKILNRHEAGRNLSEYPGSPFIAMTLLRLTAKQFLFCDIDDASLNDIRVCAVKLGISDKIVHTMPNDGISTVTEEVSKLPHADFGGLFVSIDPYRPFDKSSEGLNSIQLFCSLTEKGIKTMFWYPYDSFENRDVLVREIKERNISSNTGAARNRLWCGDISLVAIENPDFVENPGVLGCGIACGNLSDNSVRACHKFGQALQRIYTSSIFPSGQSGALRYGNIVIAE
jgi:23S rRNA (adenine2030-N6)-methyltransferase